MEKKKKKVRAAEHSAAVCHEMRFAAGRKRRKPHSITV